MNRLKRKVVDNGGTYMFDMEFLLGFLYVRIFTTKDATTDSFYQVHYAPEYRRSPGRRERASGACGEARQEGAAS
jgi:hypothetical protein